MYTYASGKMIYTCMYGKSDLNLNGEGGMQKWYDGSGIELFSVSGIKLHSRSTIVCILGVV